MALALRPWFFTEYMATSELRIRSATLLPSRGKMATPTLAVTKHSWPETKMGSRITSRMRCATRSASRSSATSGSSATNSSPPSRPTASSVRWLRAPAASSCAFHDLVGMAHAAAQPRAPPASARRRRPTWPSVSLMILKRSRSISSSAHWCCMRRACSSARSARQISWRRLGRPVSASKLASWRILSSATRRSVTSCTMPV